MRLMFGLTLTIVLGGLAPSGRLEVDLSTLDSSRPVTYPGIGHSVGRSAGQADPGRGTSSHPG
jgi:hypothetical protein